MSDKELLDYFGKKFIKHARDQAIFIFESTLSGKMKSERLITLSNELKCFDENQIDILRKAIFMSIDEVIYNTLDMLEQNEESMKLFISKEGNDNGEINVVKISDGLSGELFSEDGWIAKFSKYREYE
ncbi:hypothetical protein [Leminorella grimontii]|uniref:hypothetical protein n=1 Tax=Leminorella grimontii TaxID=82981 RepID=UPI00208993D8|nr:hypothetical protein [Leminorella grimontii]GKX59043.1 hypothetical protein SOASR031_13580 [Leminorella grimontii]